jgi:hypothetical protein
MPSQKPENTNWFLYRATKKIRAKTLPVIDRFSTSFETKIKIQGNPGFFIQKLPDDVWQLFSLPDNVLNYYLAHRFNLLGSGWVQVKYGMRCYGFMDTVFPGTTTPEIDKEGNWLNGRINQANFKNAKKVWQLIYKIKGPQNYVYQPIDWQIDFKSGHRWSEKTWHGNIHYGNALGADVKVPWELARMQHLPLLACAYGKYKETRQKTAELCLLEFRNQILDFIATNPPRWGVNWSCTMDVAIRTASWVFAYELFRNNEAPFDDAFQNVLLKSVYEHALHITKNFEWHPVYRNNHYLANICGLLYAASWLPRSSETDNWLAFALKELFTELDHQFLPDGGSFENSTSYHRLSAEMALWSVALLMNVVSKKAPSSSTYSSLPSYLEQELNKIATKLEKIVGFTSSITKPDGRIPQIGDNDSGRFLAFDIPYMIEPIASAKQKYLNLTKFTELPENSPHYEQDFLNHKELLIIGATILNKKIVSEEIQRKCFSHHIIKALTKGRKLKSSCPAVMPIAQQLDYDNERKKMLLNPSHKIYKIPLPQDMDFSLWNTEVFPDFGLCVFKHPMVYVAFRCGPLEISGSGGHLHYDAFSIELTIDGKDIFVDPGTFVYTAAPHERLKYRSAKAHFTPFPKNDFIKESDNLFKIEKFMPIHLDGIWKYGAASSITDRNSSLQVRIDIKESSIEIISVANGYAESENLKINCPSLNLSPSYGVLLAEKDSKN